MPSTYQEASRATERERDTSSWDDIIARAVKSRILPTVKCPVITSGLPRCVEVVRFYFPAPGFYPDLRAPSFFQRLRDDGRSFASATEMRPIASALDLISENDSARA